MKKRDRYLLSVPAIALLAGLAIVSMRWGFASLDVWRAGEIARQLDSAGFTLEARQALLEQGFKHLQNAQELSGDNPDVFDLRGQFLYWQAVNVAQDWDQRNRLLDQASENYLQAVKVRPLWPYFWVNLVVARAERGVFDGQFRKAVRRSVETGPWEPRVQMQLLRVDFTEQQRLDRRSREYINQTLLRALHSQPLEVFNLAKDLGQLSRVCVLPEAAIIQNRCQAAGVVQAEGGI